jgi:hypothetical protein
MEEEVWVYIYINMVTRHDIMMRSWFFFFFAIMVFFFFDNLGCPDQLTYTTTNPRTHWTSCKPSRQVRLRDGDRHVHKGSNLGCRGREFLPGPLSHEPGCTIMVSDCIGGDVVVIVVWRQQLVYHRWWLDDMIYFYIYINTRDLLIICYIL